MYTDARNLDARRHRGAVERRARSASRAHTERVAAHAERGMGARGARRGRMQSTAWAHAGDLWARDVGARSAGGRTQSGMWAPAACAVGDAPGARAGARIAPVGAHSVSRGCTQSAAWAHPDSERARYSGPGRWTGMPVGAGPHGTHGRTQSEWAHKVWQSAVGALPECRVGALRVRVGARRVRVGARSVRAVGAHRRQRGCRGVPPIDSECVLPSMSL
jgi:hypothetical protein